MLRRPPLHYEDQPFHAILQRTADSYPERIGIRCEGRSVTYRELDAAANAFTHALIRLGFLPGQRAAVIAPNRPEWIMAQLGVTQAAGAVVMPNPRWKSELTHALRLTEPTVIIADAVTAGSLEPPACATWLICLDDERPSGWLSFWDLVASSSGNRPKPVVDHWADLDVALPFSSGTTGLPKAVRHTHRSLVAATTQWKAASTIEQEDRLQLFLPLFHIYGAITIACAYWAAAPLSLHARFDVEAMLRGIEAERTTVGFGVAPMAVAMANHPALDQYDLSSIRYFLWGASPMIPDIAQAVSERAGIRWVTAYGITEMPVLTVNPIHYPQQCRLDSPGLPVSDTEFTVVGIESRLPLAPGQTGELLARGPSIMAGYLPEESTADSFEDGWFRTGDVGTVEEGGWIRITDRLKEMLKVSGFQVAPVEIEDVLFGHPAIADCAVYGVPWETGEAPKAAVVLAAGSNATEQEIKDWVADRLATYKHLASVVFVDEVPRTASGKVLRRVLRDRDLAGASDGNAR